MSTDRERPAPNSLAARRTRQQATSSTAVDSIVLSCRLKSGLFESSIEVSISATEEEMNRFVKTWLTMIEYGIKIGQHERAVEEDGQ